MYQTKDIISHFLLLGRSRDLFHQRFAMVNVKSNSRVWGTNSLEGPYRQTSSQGEASKYSLLISNIYLSAYFPHFLSLKITWTTFTQVGKRLSRHRLGNDGQVFIPRIYDPLKRTGGDSHPFPLDEVGITRKSASFNSQNLLLITVMCTSDHAVNNIEPSENMTNPWFYFLLQAMIPWKQKVMVAELNLNLGMRRGGGHPASLCIRSCKILKIFVTFSVSFCEHSVLLIVNYVHFPHVFHEFMSIQNEILLDWIFESWIISVLLACIANNEVLVSSCIGYYSHSKYL